MTFVTGRSSVLFLAGVAAAALSGLGFPTPVAATTGVASCGTLSAPGSYMLAANLATVDATCLVVHASGVILDLAGHTISCAGAGFAGSCQRPGAGPTGVRVDPGLSGVTVRGPGVIAGFDNGVSVENTAAYVTGLTVTGPSCDTPDCQRPVSNGIVVVGRFLPEGGIDLGQAPVNVVGNHVTNHGRGIALLGAQCGSGGVGCAVYGNSVDHNNGFECNGILISGVSGYAIVQNQVHANGAGDCFPQAGIAIGDSTGNVIANNDASSNVGVGIGAGPGADGNTFANNTARGNPLADLGAFPGTVNEWSDSNRCNVERGAVPPSVCNPGE